MFDGGTGGNIIAHALCDAAQVSSCVLVFVPCEGTASFLPRGDAAIGEHFHS